MDDRVVVICGGGIVGVSTAFFLAKSGVRSIVVDPCGIAPAASGKAGGFLAGGWGNRTTEDLHRLGFALHRELAKELSITSYRALPTRSADASRSQKKRDSGHPSWLSGASSSLMDSDTAQVTPAELVNKMFGVAEERGCRLVRDSVVNFRCSSSGCVEAVLLASGDAIECSEVVVSMGPWSGVALKAMGIDLPMEGICSTSVIFKDVHDIAKEPNALFCSEDRYGCHLEVYPRPNGEVYLCGLGGSATITYPDLASGGKYERADLVKPNLSRVTAATKSFTAMTSLTNLSPALSQACMRPILPDAIPVISQIDGKENAFVAAGHNCWGILWGPITGKIVADLILQGKTEITNLESFSLGRFA